MLGQNAAGMNIESYCTKCRLNLDHTVIAMEEEKIARVRCRTCGSTHKYRVPAGPRKVRARKSAQSGEETTTRIVWETGIAEARGKEREYDMHAKYRIGDIVNHEKFGKGIVVKLHDRKCDMLFQDKERLMASMN